MAEGTKKSEARKGSKKADKSRFQTWRKGLKTEWDKIIWTDRKTLGKQTGAVVAISAIICLLITLIDSLGLQIVQLIINL